MKYYCDAMCAYKQCTLHCTDYARRVSCLHVKVYNTSIIYCISRRKVIARTFEKVVESRQNGEKKIKTRIIIITKNHRSSSSSSVTGRILLRSRPYKYIIMTHSIYFFVIFTRNSHFCKIQRDSSHLNTLEAYASMSSTPFE